MEKYKRIDLEVRIKIEVLLKQGLSHQQIADELQYNKSSIYQEIYKYSGIVYNGALAHRCAQNMLKRRRKNKLKIITNQKIRSFVLAKLKLKWAPQQISERMKVDNPEDNSMRLSHESIYKFIYSMPKGELRAEIIKCLRQEKAARKKPAPKNGCKVKIPNRIGIEFRPYEVALRQIAGHWESDLIIGKEQQSAIATMVERVTRYVIIVKLISRKPIDVRQALTEVLLTIPDFMRLTMTHDNGIEMMEHSLLTENAKIQVYFAHPYSPWERGTNENTNMLIRQYFPKGTDFNTVSAEEVRRVQNELNDRPRKVLGWQTPAEVFNEMIILGKAGKSKIVEMS